MLTERLEHWLGRMRTSLTPFKHAGAGCHVSASCRVRGARGISLGEGTQVFDGAVLDAARGGMGTITLGARCWVDMNAMLMAYGGSITLGDDCSINPYSMLYGHGGLTIGSDVRITTHVIIIPANHVFQSRDIPIRAQGLQQLGVTIADDVWIGAGAVILDGVSIGRGAVIGAGAVVTRDVAEWAVMAGNPARPIGIR